MRTIKISRGFLKKRNHTLEKEGWCYWWWGTSHLQSQTNSKTRGVCLPSVSQMPGVQAHIEGKLTTCGVRATNMTHFLSWEQSQLCLTSAGPFAHNQFDFTSSLFKWVWNSWVMLGSQVAALSVARPSWTTFHQPGLLYLFKWDSSGSSDTFPVKAVPLLGRSQLGACYFSGRKYSKAIGWSWKEENTKQEELRETVAVGDAIVPKYAVPLSQPQRK